MINVLQLAAGQGSRFKDYTDVPKPFIDIDGEPMFYKAFKSMGLNRVRYHILCQESHIEKYDPSKYVDVVHTIDHYTDGAATSAYSVIAYSPFKHEQWLIIDCDFILVGEVNLPNASAIVVEQYPWDIKSSYSYVDTYNTVMCVAEKQCISQWRNTGQYLFESGELFCEAYEFYRDNKLLSNGEFYIAPLYNYIVQSGYDVTALKIARYVPIGTPDDLEKYLNEKRNIDI